MSKKSSFFKVVAAVGLIFAGFQLSGGFGFGGSPPKTLGLKGGKRKGPKFIKK